MKRILCFGVLSCLCLSGAALASETADESSKKGCSGGFMEICGTSLGVSRGALGNVQTLRMPEKFQNRSVIVQCLAQKLKGDDVRFYYKILDVSSTDICALKKCAAEDVSLCDQKISIPAGVTVLTETKVAVPATLLADPYSTPPSLLARCVLNGEQTHYEVMNKANMSCNLFACQPTQLSVCNSVVSVDRRARLGDVFQLKTQNGQAVSVQCLGSGGKAPQFTVVNNACR